MIWTSMFNWQKLKKELEISATKNPTEYEYDILVWNVGLGSTVPWVCYPMVIHFGFGSWSTIAGSQFSGYFLHSARGT